VKKMSFHVSIFMSPGTNTSLPLACLNIVVTRPREQAAALTKEINRLGGICTQLPLLEIFPLADDTKLRALIARLHEYQLAIFVSPNAVRYGMEAIKLAGGLPPLLPVATVGLSSAKALHDFGVVNVIAPQHQFDSESLLALPELQAVKQKRIVIFRGESGRELLGDTLKSRGAIVEYVACYHRGKPQHDISDLLAAMPDALSISSSEALRNLYDMLNPACLEYIMALPLFVSHARIFAEAQKLGWHNIIETADGDKGLMSALISWAAHRVR
jgi:uroporphyrinogen-III synthase